MTLVHQLTLDYVALNPVPHTGESSWDQMCGNLMFRFGQYADTTWAPGITGPTAWDVARASGPHNPDDSAAPVGAFHWWKNRTGDGTPGHVGLDTYGGGHTVFMASYALEHVHGKAIGYQSITGYNRARPAMEYSGWTTSYAGAHILTDPPKEPQTIQPGEHMNIIAIEQNLDPNDPSYMMIGVGGTPRGWIEIPPQNRNYYDVLRGVLCHYARVINPDAPDVLPKIPAGVNTTGWRVTANAYQPGLSSHELA